MLVFLVTVFSFLGSIRQAVTCSFNFQLPHLIVALFSPGLSLFVHVLFKKNLLFDISFVSRVSEIRWLVKMAFLTARFSMISFSHGRPWPREKKECDEVQRTQLS